MALRKRLGHRVSTTLCEGSSRMDTSEIFETKGELDPMEPRDLTAEDIAEIFAEGEE